MQLNLIKSITVTISLIIGFIALSNLNFIKKKNIIIVFSSTNNCTTCLQLEKEVLNKSNLKKSDVDKLIILKKDLLKNNKNKSTINAKQKFYNKINFKRYNPKMIFPLVVLLNRRGKIINIKY